MPKCHPTDRARFHPLLAAFAAWAFLAASAPAAAESCAGATALNYNETHQGSGTELLALTLPSTGVLTLDVSSPAPDVQPKIDFLGTTTHCGGAAGEGTAFDYVRQSPKWLALDVHAASSTTYYLRVAPQDSKQSLGDFKLRVAWVADPASPTEQTDLSPDATNACNASSSPLSESDLELTGLIVVKDAVDQWDEDIMQLTAGVPGVLVVDHHDPGGPDLQATLYRGLTCSAAVDLGSVLSSASGRIAAAVHPGDYSLRLVPYDLASGDYEVAVRFYAPCGLVETDDHRDSPLCATAIGLGGGQNGQIDGADDEDWFTVVLAAQSSVEIETTGDVDTYGSLYDAAGQRLEIDDDDGTDGNFRIARTLGPGRYYVRVERASGEDESYELALEEGE
jgi:hypothetical protein